MAKVILLFIQLGPITLVDIDEVEISSSDDAADSPDRDDDTDKFKIVNYHSR